MPDASILDTSVAAAPKAYRVAGAQEIVVKAVSASFDGSGAGGSYVPAVQVVDPSGFVVGTYVLQQTLAAGVSADVSFFPGVNAATAGSSGTSTQSVTVPLITPDNTGNGFPGYTGNFGASNALELAPAFINGRTGVWHGRVRIPPNYVSGGVLTCSFAAANTVGSIVTMVSSAVIPAGTSIDTAYTDEASSTTTVSLTTLGRFDVATTLTTTLAANADLNVKVTRLGGNPSDNYNLAVLLWNLVLTYTGN